MMECLSEPGTVLNSGGAKEENLVLVCERHTLVSERRCIYEMIEGVKVVYSKGLY